MTRSPMTRSPISKSNFNWIPVVIAAAALAAAAWWYLGPEPEPVPEAAPPATAAPAEPEPETPVHPLPGPEPAPDPGELVELPALDDSDGYFSLALGDLLGPGIDELLVGSGVIEKFVATIDNLPREKIADSIRPLGRPAGSFQVDELDDDTYTISPANADRYQPLVDMLTSADVDAIYATYERFYPLFQQAYENLGYPDAYFNDRVVEVIDHLLATPVPERPPVLVRPHVLYQYEDPELESLSSGQKALLRLGPDQAARVKTVLREFRAKIA